jgi:hypothetical protein
MTDEERISYLALENGTPVLTTEGTEIGVVEHVLQDSDLDLFDGIVVKTKEGLRFVDADQAGEITTKAVRTTVADADADKLPAPAGNAVLSADPTEYDGNGLGNWFGRMFLREHWMRNRDDR